MARVWQVTSWRIVATLEGHQDNVNSASFSHNGRFIVTASADRYAGVWELSNPEKPVELKGHTNGVVSAAFSQDDERIITASLDRTARAWDAKTGTSLAVLSGHTSSINTALFSPDGKLALTASGHANPDGESASPKEDASDDTTARVWDVSQLSNFYVSAVAISVEPEEDYEGPCPVIIRLIGTIKVVGGSGQVTYRFVSNKGRQGSERTLTFDQPGSKVVGSTWKTARDGDISGTESFYIVVTLSPTQKWKSDPKEFRYNCTSFEQSRAP